VSSGFLEPLESTGHQLIMEAVERLIELFPDRDCHPGLAAEFNRQMARQYESVSDFIVLHYKLTQRSDSEFWRYCAAMPVPDTLAHGHGFERQCPDPFVGIGHFARAQPMAGAASLPA
jgi:hypothetical protein